MQQDLDALDPHLGAEEEEGNENGNGNGNGNEKKSIPESLKAYIKQVRGHCLVRDFNPRWAKDEEEIEKARKLRKARRKGEVLSEEEEAIRVLTVGMKPKKMHEVRSDDIVSGQSEFYQYYTTKQIHLVFLKFGLFKPLSMRSMS